MKRVLCIWLPNWPVQRLCAARPELKGRAVALYASAGHPALPRAARGPAIVARSAEAAAQGVALGMPLAEATTMRHECGMRSAECGVRGSLPSSVTPHSALRIPHFLHYLPHDPLADRAALERLAEWCGQFSPTVGLEDADLPDALLLDITGLGPLFGGEDTLIERVWRALAGRGLEVRVAVADTVGAAWALARFQSGPVAPQPEPLASLPIEALRLAAGDVHTLLELGIEQVGQLLALPRSGLAARFSPGVLQRVDQALGWQAEVIVAHRPPPLVQAAWTFEPAANSREPLQAALERTTARIIAELAERRHGVTQFDCLLYPAAGDCARWSIGLFRPSGAARHLQELVALRWEQARLPDEVAALRLEVTASAPLECRQRELTFDDPRGDSWHCDEATAARELAGLLDRLIGRLGREAVLRARPRADAQPELACRYEPWSTPGTTRRNTRKKTAASTGQHAEGEPAAIHHRPLRLSARPLPIEVVSVVPDGPPITFCVAGRRRHVRRACGPERIETGWWRQRSAGRDYYRVADDTGGWFWLYRRLRDGRWFWHGTFE
jgi:protein ImuB